MKKRAKKVLLLSALCAMSVGIAAATVQVSNIATAETAVWEDLVLQEKYNFGTQLSIPKRTVTVNGKQYTVEGIVKYPNGLATKEEKIVLDQGGQYVVTYSITVNGKSYIETEEFGVIDRMFAHQNNGSLVEYCNHSDEEKCTSLHRNQFTSREGLYVRLAKGDELVFSQVIDLKDATKDTTLFEFFAAPDSIGVAEFEKLYVRFTDVEDSSKYLIVSARQYAEGIVISNSYIQVAGENQPMTGYEAYWDKIHVEGRWGTPVTHNFGACNIGGLQENTSISFRYNQETKEFYANNSLVADMDDVKYFSNEWDGFSSNKVRVSVWADMYNTKTANFFIPNVYGVDLKAETFEDINAPILRINNDYTSMPEAKTGGKYPVPMATAIDWNDGACKVKRTVWFNYSSENAVMIPITNGQFPVDYEGEYVIEYTATDKTGNVAKEILTVNANNDVPALEITGIQGREEIVEKCGYWITLGAIEYSGGSGVVDYSVKVTFDGQPIELEDNAFRAEKAGKYSVIYTAVDYIGQKTEYAFELNIQANETPVFLNKPELPEFFIEGGEYVVPTYYVNDYSTGELVQRVASVSIKDANGEVNKQIGDRFTPSVEKNGDFVTVTFLYEGIEEEYLVPTIRRIENNEVAFENYLYGEGFTLDKRQYDSVVTANASDASWVFANKLVADGFSAELNSIEKRSNFEGILITLYDSVDKTQKITALLKVSGSATKVEIGNFQSLLNIDFTKNSSIKLGFRNNTLSVGTLNREIERYDNGKEFVGFTSGYVMFSVSFYNAKVGAQYGISNIGGQPLIQIEADYVAPKISVQGNYGGSYSLNDCVTLPKIICGDVLDPNVECTLTVKLGDKIVSTVDGIQLSNVDPNGDYTIKLEEFGQYTVRYSAMDTTCPTRSQVTFSYIVADSIVPTIEWTSGAMKTAKVGDVLVMSDFKVSDNITDADKIVVVKFVYNPNGKLIKLSDDSNSIKCTYVGIYEFRVMAIDEAGNMSMLTQRIEVKE